MKSPNPAASVGSGVAPLFTEPAGLSFEEAAVLPYPGAVSLQAIRDRAAVERGQTMLIVGASGAVGTIALQIAKAFGEVGKSCKGCHDQFRMDE